MCLLINKDKTDEVRLTYPDEFEVYKVLTSDLKGPWANHQYTIGMVERAEGELKYKDQIQEGGIHCFLKLQDAKTYIEKRPGPSKHDNKQYCIIKCKVYKKYLIACGTVKMWAGFDKVFHCDDSVCFLEIIPVSIIESEAL